MLLTAKLMLDWLKETDMATRLESAIARVIAEGKVRTYDMGGKASTLDVAKAVADYAGITQLGHRTDQFGRRHSSLSLVTFITVLT